MAITAKVTSTSATKSFGTQTVSKTSESFNIDASEIPIDLSSLPDSRNVQNALDELHSRFIQSLLQPSTGISEGDLWYDLANSKLKLYGSDSSWGLISGAATALEDEYFKFTSSDELSSGNLAEFVNDDETIFAVSHDGIVKLRDVGDETPDAIAGGLYVKGSNLYFGQ